MNSLQYVYLLYSMYLLLNLDEEVRQYSCRQRKTSFDAKRQIWRSTSSSLTSQRWSPTYSITYKLYQCATFERF
ncbi:unnamed protein product [Wuchereria bancrofti]|uniref:Uncharacterized protein n=2 Tax=Wuchereria bancrofti TaxID=6293 RepID=A0A3P7DZ34_WUCBA|nr:unnamed protein product [Wuchereria bancrofti]